MEASEASRVHAPLVAAAAARLSERLGGDVQLELSGVLSNERRRNLVLRCMASRSGEALQSVIIKQARGEYHAGDAKRRLFNDWAGAEFLSSLPGEAHGPRFLAGDRALGFVVLEDLGEPHRSLVQPFLEGSVAEAEAVLRLYMQRLARMHGSSMGVLHHYESLLAALHAGASARAPDPLWPVQSADIACRFLDAQGLLSPTFERLLRAAALTATTATPFQAFIHGDACPDNTFVRGGELLLIDFEMAYAGSALLDAVYVWAPFPTCWCANRIPTALAGQLLELYRAELVAFCPSAADDALFGGALLDALAFSLVLRLSRHLPKAWQADETWGINSLRPRILTGLEHATAAAERWGGDTALGDEASRLRASLGERWPETQALPLYPAFRRTT